MKMWDDHDLAEVSLACEDIKNLRKINIGGTDHSKEISIHPYPLTCPGEKNPRMKVNKYSHLLKNLGKQITTKKLNIIPQPPSMCGGEDLMDESKQTSSLK